MMLILMRRLGESIQIGENITITVTRITRESVKLGIAAPENIRISRIENHKTEQTK